MPKCNGQIDRKVITFWGYRGWSDPDLEDHNTGQVSRGYKGLNAAIQGLPRKLTIHSISYSTIIMPPWNIHGNQLIHMAATVLYSGDFDTSEDTVFEIEL